MKLAIIGLSGLLLLTGCASSPSLESQTKLIEYEKCLEHATEVSNLVMSTFTRENPLIGIPVTNYTHAQKRFEELILACEGFKP